MTPLVVAVVLGIIAAVLCSRRTGSVDTLSPSLKEWLRRNGWQVDGERYVGRFRTTFGVVVGRVRHSNGGYEVYLHKPPDWFLRGKHAACMRHVGDAWWWVHQNSHQTSIVDAIRATEGLLIAKFEEHQCRRSA